MTKGLSELIENLETISVEKILNVKVLTTIHDFEMLVSEAADVGRQAQLRNLHSNLRVGTWLGWSY